MLPVVLAPGLLCDSRLWAAVTKRLQGPVIEVDFSADGGLDQMAARILAASADRFVLAGFSMGGMAAVAAAAVEPARVAGLALIDTHAEPETPARRTRRAQQIARAISGDFRGLVIEDLKPAYFSKTRTLAAERTLCASMAFDLGPAQFRRHVLALMSRSDPRGDLARLRMPTTVIAGADDRVVPVALAEALWRALPQGRLVTIQDCGHMAPLEAPDVVAAEIERLVIQAEATHP